ncbi:unnamed protein product [Blepharisma stoltei]|uniref:Uncharacterized protein n=1 Tax=Blepharisma stoltei TaxID=1481888 RepID=A0AAU9ISK4_9CILI|nr:unnamed protein product [Blepharisma stoltei]
MESDRDENNQFSHDKLNTINIELSFGDKFTKEKELILNIKQPILTFSREGEVNLSAIITYLKNEGYPIDKSMIWYYSPTAKLNVYCGTDPIPPSISIPIFEIKDRKLVLLCYGVVSHEIGPVLQAQNSVAAKKMHEEEPTTLVPKISRRTTERKIGYIIDKVMKWRKLYSGVIDGKGDLKKMTLEDAARKVGIAKKSLDDYLLQLRSAKKFGFNFQEHKDDRVGILRAYVKKYKTVQQYITKIEEGENIPENVLKLLQEPGTSACKDISCCQPSFAKPGKRQKAEENSPLMYLSLSPL